MCVVKGSPWIQENSSDLHKRTKYNKDSLPIDSTNINNITLTHEVNPKAKTIDSPSDKVKECTNNILIVDNIDNTNQFKSSIQIQNELEKHPEIPNVKFGYSLPRGGIALHFESDEEALDTIKNWPSEVFSKKEAIHRPKEKNSNTVGFVKNISLKVNEHQVQSYLQDKGCLIDYTQRLYHRHSGRPMPVLKIIFTDNTSLLKATSLLLPFTLNGKRSFCEESRRLSSVRCYKCQTFGHIYRHCDKPKVCENCSSPDHLIQDCHSNSVCVNCQGNHTSSSNKCPEYIKIIQKLRSNSIIDI